MDSTFRVFDFHRIFVGDAPLSYLMEIVFRTLIMYTYTVVLLRILGKRGMGQLSMLELAIIISFGSAVGDPMMGADVPILHGVVAITAVTIFQIGLERLINKNRKVEALLEGTPDLIIEDGVIQWECMIRDNLSREDLFRSLRAKDVEHLGQIQKAFFETSGTVSVFFQPPRKVKPGLTILPEEMIPPETILAPPMKAIKAGVYCCFNCGNTKTMKLEQLFGTCKVCQQDRWIEASNGIATH
jgi:uncharacterized membrane protein YcaP (DUF421 family)